MGPWGTAEDTRPWWGTGRRQGGSARPAGEYFAPAATQLTRGKAHDTAHTQSHKVEQLTFNKTPFIAEICPTFPQYGRRSEVSPSLRRRLNRKDGCNKAAAGMNVIAHVLKYSIHLRVSEKQISFSSSALCRALRFSFQPHRSY